VIGRLRRVLSSALGRGSAAAEARSASAETYDSEESARRIEAARRRLKATIPPPPENA
jgi:hypothetical protein